jgi:tetratricopeptide (TPR) repeat protein
MMVPDERPRRRALGRRVTGATAWWLAAFLGCGAVDDPAATTVAAVARLAPLDAGRPAALPVASGSAASPSAPEALRVRGMLLEQAGQLDAALALYEDSIPRFQQPWSLLERQAQVLAWQRRFDAALAAYARVADSVDAPQGLRLRCRVRMTEITAWKADLDGALAQLRSLLVGAPEHVEALLLQGQILEWKGDYAGAKHSYSRILSVDADQADARSRLGKLLWVD